MALTATTKLNDLKVLFNDVKEIYFSKSEIKSTDLATLSSIDIELPILEEGVTFNTGEAEVTSTKLTTGTIWTSKATKGDPDISFQVASVAGAVNDIFMNKVGSEVSSISGIVDNVSYKGVAYSLAPKKVTGALVMMSEDRQSVIILPSVEIYASFTAADGDNPAYFTMNVTPVENSEGSDIFILGAEVTEAGE